MTVDIAIDTTGRTPITIMTVRDIPLDLYKTIGATEKESDGHKYKETAWSNPQNNTGMRIYFLPQE